MFHMKGKILIFVHNFERFSPKKVGFASFEPKSIQNIMAESQVSKWEINEGLRVQSFLSRECS